MHRGNPEQATIAILDYKMKFEPLRFRETSTEFYGKRGMSWNGSVVFHSTRIRRSADSGSDGSPEVGEDELSGFVTDHVVRKCTTQDTCASVMITGAVIARAHK